MEEDERSDKEGVNSERMRKERFNCKKCQTVINGHNLYLHDGMCDDCFFEVYFPEEVQVFATDVNELSRICRLQ